MMRGLRESRLRPGARYAGHTRAQVGQQLARQPAGQSETEVADADGELDHREAGTRMSESNLITGHGLKIAKTHSAA